MLKRAVLWIRSNLFRRRYEREMREEMQEHLDRATRRLMGRGLPVEEARRQARREFGDVAYHQTEAREARGTLWFDDLWGDARFAVRHFARTPGTTLMMFIVLAAGLSISTLLFSWVHGISVMPPPAVELDDDLVRIRGSRASSSADRASRWFAEEEFLAYRQLTSHFRAVAGWIDRSGVLQLPSDSERRGHPVDLAFVTEDYFSVLGIQPALGAGLPRGASSDAASSAVAVIDYQAWRDLFGQRPDIIGSTVIINGQAITIVGVATTGATTYTYSKAPSGTQSNVVTVTAKSVADPSKTGAAVLTLIPPRVKIALSDSTTIRAGAFRYVTGAVYDVGTAAYAGVTWQLSPAIGVLDTVKGTYTAPAGLTATQQVQLKATSVADPRQSATVTLTLVP